MNAIIPAKIGEIKLAVTAQKNRLDNKGCERISERNICHFVY